MWRTFVIEYTKFQELDEFLEKIENEGYYPAYMRETYRWAYRNRMDNKPTLIFEAAITARKKDA